MERMSPFPEGMIAKIVAEPSKNVEAIKKAHEIHDTAQARRLGELTSGSVVAVSNTEK